MIIDKFNPSNQKQYKTSAVLSSYLAPLESKVITVEVGKTVQQIIDENSLDDVVIYKDDVLLSTEYIIKENDVVYVYAIPEGGSGGELLKMAAVIAVAVAVNAIVGPYFGPGITGQIMTGLVTAGASMATAYALNKWFPPDIPTTGDSLGTDSSTYGWGDTTNQKTEGAILPILLGTHRVVPPYISVYVDTAQDGKQTLNQLFAVNYGEVEFIKDVIINDNKIENYEKTTYHIRYGTKDQTVMGIDVNEPDFTKIRTDYSKGNVRLNTDWYNFETNQEVDRLGLTLNFNGLGEFDSSGNLIDHEVECEAQYSLDGLSWEYIKSLDLSPEGLMAIRYKGTTKVLIPNDYSGFAYKTTTSFDLGGRTILTSRVSAYESISNLSLTEATIVLNDNVTYYKYNATIAFYKYRESEYGSQYSQSSVNYHIWSSSNTLTSGSMTSAGGTLNLTGMVNHLSCLDNTQEARIFYFSTDTIAKGKYFVRARRKLAESTSTKILDKCYLISHSEYLAGVQQRFPSVALLGVKALATDQLSGNLPSVSAVVSRIKDINMPLDNPAWACKFLIEEYLNGSVNYYKFEEWANYCNTNGYTVNLYLETQMSMKRIIDMVASLGQGYIFQRGTEWDCRWEAYDTAPVQAFIFNDSNVAYDSYSEQYLSIDERFNTLELTYFDKTLDYERNTIIMQQENVIDERKTSLVLYGCTDRDMAIKLGKIALRKSKYETLVSSWSCDIDAIHCSIYDIVYVQHSAPKWNNGSGGIILEESNSTTIKLDQEVTLDAGVSYRVRLQNIETDTVDEYFTVPAIEQTKTDILTFSSNIYMPKNSKYTFDDGRYFKVVNISKLNDLKMKITAVEYIPEIYDIAREIVPIEYKLSSATSNIEFNEFLEYDKQGNVVGVLNVSFMANRLSNNIYVGKKVNNKIKYDRVAKDLQINTFNIHKLKDGTSYFIKVNEVETEYTFLGKLAKPNPVEDLGGSESGNRFYLSWTYDNPPLDFKEFRIYKGSELLGNTKAFVYETQMIPSTEAVTFSVVAVDTSNVESDISSVSIGLSEVEPVSNLTGYVSDGNLFLNWDYDKPFDFAHFDVYDTDVYIGNSTKNLYIAPAKHHDIGVVKYSVVAKDLSGNESVKTDVNIEFTVATLENFEATFNTNVCTLTFDCINNSYPIKEYIFRDGAKTFKSSTTRVSFDVDWLGVRRIYAKAVDIAGNEAEYYYDVTVLEPQAPIVSASASEKSGIEFIWTCPFNGTLGIKEYIIKYNGNVISTKDTKYFTPITTASSYSLDVNAIDWAGNETGYSSYTYTISFADVYSLNVSSRDYDCLLTFESTKGTFEIKDYKIEYGSELKYITTKYYNFVPNGTSAITFTITPRDVAGNLGTSRQVAFTPLAPLSPTVTQVLKGKDLTLTIEPNKKSFKIANNVIYYDDKVVNTLSGSSSWSIPIFWDLTKTFYVETVDVLGNVSSQNSVSVTINEGEVTYISTDVVDNNVLIKWQYTDGTLPIEHFRISKGDVYETSVEIGIRKGSFSAIFEREAGTFTYWITPIDTAGNEGIYKGVTTSVAQPPDFILNAEWDSSYSNATTTNIKVGQNGRMVLPVDNSITIEDHFINNLWDTPQEQIDGLFPLWLTPSNGTSEYEEIFDYGAVLGSTNITLNDPIINKFGVGAYSFTRQISTSLDGITYTDAPLNSSQIFITNIQYVKVKYVFTCDTDTLIEVQNFKLRLDAKIISDGGTGTAINTDVGGTTVLFNKPFVDITSINVTPSGTTPLIAIYDFVDAPNPTEFKVLLYTTTGVRASGGFSWSVKGY